VRSGADLARLALAGAVAAEAVSVVMAEGFGALGRILAELDAFLAGRDLEFSALVGRAADARASYADQPGLNARWRSFVPPETLQRAGT
ncbi:MAG: dihydroorotate dehydrogenase, partial [Acetobacteraceae bacterium]